MRLGGSRFLVQFNVRINFVAMRENEETQNASLHDVNSHFRVCTLVYLTDGHSPHYWKGKVFGKGLSGGNDWILNQNTNV